MNFIQIIETSSYNIPLKVYRFKPRTLSNGEYNAIKNEKKFLKNNIKNPIFFEVVKTKLYLFLILIAIALISKIAFDANQVAIGAVIFMIVLPIAVIFQLIPYLIAVSKQQNHFKTIDDLVRKSTNYIHFLQLAKKQGFSVYKHVKGVESVTIQKNKQENITVFDKQKKSEKLNTYQNKNFIGHKFEYKPHKQSVIRLTLLGDMNVWNKVSNYKIENNILFSFEYDLQQGKYSKWFVGYYKKKPNILQKIVTEEKTNMVQLLNAFSFQAENNSIIGVYTAEIGFDTDDNWNYVFEKRGSNILGHGQDENNHCYKLAQSLTPEIMYNIADGVLQNVKKNSNEKSIL